MMILLNFNYPCISLKTGTRTHEMTVRMGETLLIQDFFADIKKCYIWVKNSVALVDFGQSFEYNDSRWKQVYR